MITKNLYNYTIKKKLLFFFLYFIISSSTTITEKKDMSLETQLQIIENLFKKNTNWSLIKFLNYRAKDKEFTYNKRKEYLLYKSVLSLLSKNYT